MQVFASVEGSVAPLETEDGYCDPRTVDNLVDGHNYTTDDLHAWVAPFKVLQSYDCYRWCLGSAHDVLLSRVRSADRTT
jgi:hypothetical protein